MVVEDTKARARGCTRVLATLRKTRQFLDKHCENTQIFEIRQSVTDRHGWTDTDMTDRQKMTTNLSRVSQYYNPVICFGSFFQILYLPIFLC
jgi:hypothetical protein